MSKLLTDNGASGRAWWRAAYWGIAAVILASAFIATNLSDEVTWTLGDFAVAAVLLALTGLAIEAAFRLIATPLMRALAVAGSLFAMIVLWMLLAMDVPV